MIVKQDFATFKMKCGTFGIKFNTGDRFPAKVTPYGIEVYVKKPLGIETVIVAEHIVHVTTLDAESKYEIDDIVCDIHGKISRIAEIKFSNHGMFWYRDINGKKIGYEEDLRLVTNKELLRLANFNIDVSFLR